MGDERFALEAVWRGTALTWRLSGHLGTSAAALLAEIGPVLAMRHPSEIWVGLDGVSMYESSAVAVLQPMLRQLAASGTVVTVGGGFVPLRRLLQPPAEEPPRHPRPPPRWAS